MEAQSGQIIQMCRISSHVQSAEQCVFLFSRPSPLGLHMVTDQGRELEIRISSPMTDLTSLFSREKAEVCVLSYESSLFAYGKTMAHSLIFCK